MEDYAQCIILFLQRGVQLSPHYPDVTYFLGHYLQGSIQAKKRLYYTRKIADLVFGQWLPPLIQEEVVASNSKDNKTLSSTTSSKECPMCLTSNDTKCKPNNTPIIALYCGHYFCEEHLRTHVTSVHAATDLQKIMSCPTCIRPLCKDILGDHPPTENDADLLPLQQQRRLGLMRLGLEQLQFECKARNLEVPQDHLKEHCLESLVADWRDFTVPQSYMEQGDDDEVQMSSRLIFELSMSRTMISQDHYLWVAPTQGSVMIPITAKGIPIMALVSTTSPYTVVSPRFVQMFGLCTNSNLQYTARNPLKFTRAQGDDDDEQDGVPERPINHNDPEEEEAKPRPKPTFITAPEVHLTAVEGFTFTLGNHNGSGSNTAGGFDNIEVRLDSVFQISEPNTHLFPVGVVLGLDFFQSAAWTQMSVEVDLEVCLGRTIALFTGGLKTGSGLHFDLVEPRRADFIEEEFRYYSHDGKIFWTPLWHVYVSKYDYCLSLEQYLAKPQPPPERGEMLPPKETQVEMVECAYCCRKFPHDPKGDSRSLWDILLSKPKNLGMIHCRLCEKDKPTFYCDEHCRQKAQVAHSILRHYGTDFSRDTRIEDAASIYKKTLAFWITLTAVIAAIYVMPGGKSENGVENVAGQADMQSDALKFQKGSGEEENTTLFSASKSPTDFVSEL